MQWIEYIIIFVFQAIGIACGVLNEIRRIRKIDPNMRPIDVWRKVKHEDWDTLLGSAIVLLLCEFIHLVMDLKGVEPPGIMGAWWFNIAFSLVMGWGGQDILFKWLGTAKKAVLDKVGGTSTTTIEETETAGHIKTTVKSETITPKTNLDGN